MISCTEFIPLYSELFWFIERKGGHEAVVRYWEYLSDAEVGDETNPNSLASFMNRANGDLDGAWKYWEHTLSEENCDILRIYDPKNKTIYSHMRHCPSKGMLLDLKHIEPYYDYCEHCNVVYRRVLERFGYDQVQDNTGIDHAECGGMICKKGYQVTPEAYEPTEDKIIMDIHTGDNKYLHRDFHVCGDQSLEYCARMYGENGLREYLRDFTKNHYGPWIADIKERGLRAIQEKIEKTYEIEEAAELLHTELSDTELTVTVDHCPVIAYMKTLNQKPTKYYIEETRTVYEALADACDLGFTMDYYREDGATRYHFFKRGF